MNYLSILKNLSTKRNTWCYRQGFYQIPYQYKRKESKIINYSKWKAIQKNNQSTKQKKIKEFIN